MPCDFWKETNDFDIDFVSKFRTRKVLNRLFNALEDIVFLYIELDMVYFLTENNLHNTHEMMYQSSWK